jgi:uncharacterized protein
MKTSTLFISIFLFFVLSLSAQVNEFADTSVADISSIYSLAKVENGKVVIRWAPTSFIYWDIGSTYGYKIERIAFSKNPFLEADQLSEEDYQFVEVPESPLMPWTEEMFRENIADDSNVYLGVAMEMLYGDMGNQGNLEKGTSLKDNLMDQGNRFAYTLLSADLNREAALSLGLRYEDQDVSNARYYYYRITFNHIDPDLKLDTLEFLIDMEEVTPDYPVSNCMVEPYDGAISISWTRHNATNFSAFDVERSPDNRIWEKLNSKPYTSGTDITNVGFVYIDTNVINKKTYYYRLRGYTPFGEYGKYSKVMSTAPVDLTPPAPAFNIQAEDQGGVVMITWEAQPNEPDFDGFFVGRSYLASGGFEKISEKLPSTARAFVDFLPDPLENNYYTVITVDKDGNEAPGYVALGYIVDSIPPDPPTGIKGEIDSTGIVTLRWARGPEADIIGYRVYWANDSTSEFSQLTGEVHAHTVFRDSVNLKTLTKYVYYKIAAVDHRYNHSAYSDIFKLKRPDIVPPASPVISDYKLEQFAVLNVVAFFDSFKKSFYLLIFRHPKFPLNLPSKASGTPCKPQSPT